MNEPHRVYLVLGSNIEPQTNLQRAVDLLLTYGSIGAASSIWESEAVGSTGPTFWNAALLLLTKTRGADLKSKIIRPIEAALGRVRDADKNAPRTIDIDVVMVDAKPVNIERWSNAYVVVPMAELQPSLLHPRLEENLKVVARKRRTVTWIVPRRGVSLAYQLKHPT